MLSADARNAPPATGRRTMRVLVLHSQYATGASSGENRVVEDEVQLLRSAGHQVELMSPTPRTDSALQRAGAAGGAVWNRRARQAVAARIRELQPDVLHAHNLFPALSPAVLRLDVPTVVTLHNYRLLCLPADFLRDGRICEDCLGRSPWRGVVHRCYRGSAGGSAAVAASLALHRAAGSFAGVDRYLAVSEFVRDKHIEAGWDPARITVKPNFASAMPRRDGAGAYFLYLGRLSPEKGLDRLLPLWDGVPARLLVVGDGEERARLEACARGDVEFLGEVPPGRVPELLAGARALVLPSICYEGAPRTVVEAFAAGVPAIANARGNLPRMIPHDAGILVDPAEPEGWVRAAEALLDDDASVSLGDGAHRQWQNRYSPDIAERALREAYTDAIVARHGP